MSQNKGDNWVRVFQVGDPKRHKNGFTIYKVTSVVFPKNAPEAMTNIVVWKRFTDFKKLHNSLKLHHKNFNIAEELPKLSGSKYFKRFEDEIIQERIQCALELLNFIGRHPPLFTCAPFKQFFNNNYQVSDTVTDNESTITNDNGNVSDSASDLCNNTYTEKNHLNGEVKKESFQDERNLIDSDNSCLHSASSEDETEGTETFLKKSNGFRSEKTVADEEEEEDVEEEEEEVSCGNMAKSLTSLPDHFAGEMVTCHAEKPIARNEVWVYVNANERRSKSQSTLPTTEGFAAEDYLVEAGHHIGQAQKCEIVGEYESAFGFYKAAMACLLSGLSEDECKERRLAVQEKIKQYAQRAENMYALHLSKRKEEEKESMLSCTEALKPYKVLSVIDKVLLVQNTSEDKRYVIKVLEKSPCPVDTKKKTIIPYNVPYMVKLNKHFENENSIFLVLEYAAGGKLWDYVDRCHHSYGNSVSNDIEPDTIEYRAVDVENAKDTPIGEKSEKSYFEILKDYTAYTAKKVFGYEETDAKVLNADGSVSAYSVLQEHESGTPANEDIVIEDNLDIRYLVENSQKLLESIKNTLEQSEYVTDTLTKDLNDIETALGKDIPDKSDDGEGSEGVSKKRSKSVARSRFERRYSSEDMLESRSRTASSSLDRSGQWSRLNAMLESAPVLSEATIREWAAEMFVALETLHRWGVTCRDLHPGNVLLDEKGHILLTFQLHWRGVDASISEEAVTGLYAAPETTKIFPVTPVADWWSYGALLFQLLTGKPLSLCYPSGILSHTIITFPEFLSPEACSLLTELLRYDPSERLGGGVNGSDDIKCHPFFNSVDWQLVYDN